jgi:hypothetical protein
MSAKISACDFVSHQKKQQKKHQKINFDRLVDIMSKTKFYQFDRDPTSLEKPAAERDIDSFHAARLFNLSEIWADRTRAAEAKREKIEKLENFAASFLLEDIRSGKLGVWVLPSQEASSDAEIKVELQKLALKEQEKTGKNYHSPTVVYWLGLHGFDAVVLKKCFDETYNLLQEVEGDFLEIIEEDQLEAGVAQRASSSEHSSAHSSESVLTARPDALEIPAASMSEESESPRKNIAKFPLNTQVTLFYKYLFSALFLAFYEGDETQLSIGDPEAVDQYLSAQEFRLFIKTMIAKTCAEITILNSEFFSPPSRPSQRLKSPGTPGLGSPRSSFHVHRRKLSMAAQYSQHREEVTHSCPEIYHANPLHFVLDYLDSQMNNYDIHSKDWEVISRKREVVTAISRQIDARQMTLAEGVEALLREDELYQRRHAWDCWHKTPRTVRLIKACVQGVKEVEKLLPKAALGRGRHSKVKRVMGEITVT